MQERPSQLSSPVPAVRDSIRAAFVFDGPARDAVLRLKYSGRSYLAERIASFMVPDDTILIVWYRFPSILPG